MRRYVFYPLLFIGIQTITSQVQFSSLQDVFTYADDHAYAIQLSEVQQKTDEAKKQQAHSFLYPSVTAVSGYTDNLTLQSTLVPVQLFDPSVADDEYREITFGKQYVYSAGVQVQWDILNLPKILGAKMTDKNVYAGMTHTGKVRFETYNQLASTYYAILLSQKTMDFYAENVALTKTLLQNSQEKYRKGIISEAELNRATIRHIRNEKDLEYVTYSMEQLYRQLQSQLGISSTVEVSGDIETPIITHTHITTVNPEVIWQKSQVDVAALQLQQAKAKYLPSLSFQYQYNHNWATDHFSGLSDAYKIPSQYFGVKLTIPLFNGLSTRGKVKESKTKLQLQQIQLQNVQLAKSKEDEIVQLQYVQHENGLDKTKEILELQKINDMHSSNKYQSGIIGLDERLDTYEDLLIAQHDYIQRLTDYAITQYKIYIRQINFNTQQ